jgi:hypothetical protein
VSYISTSGELQSKISSWTDDLNLLTGHNIFQYRYLYEIIENNSYYFLSTYNISAFNYDSINDLYEVYIPHMLNSGNLMIQIKNEEGYKIFANEISYIDNNVIRLSFIYPVNNINIILFNDIQ